MHPISRTGLQIEVAAGSHKAHLSLSLSLLTGIVQRCSAWKEIKPYSAAFKRVHATFRLKEWADLSQLIHFHILCTPNATKDRGTESTERKRSPQTGANKIKNVAHATVTLFIP